MRAVIQRVKQASVAVEGQVISSIGVGFLVLFAVHVDDTADKIAKLADKIVKSRIFEDESGKMNKSLRDIDGEVLVVSQFTLYGDATDGNRPSFIKSARPEKAEPMYQEFIEELKKRGVKKVAEGKFGALMEVALVNYGPTTIILDI